MDLRAKILAGLAGVAIWLAPIKAMMILIGVSIVMDTIVGVYKSRKLGIPITSSKLSNVIFKMLAYQSAIVTLFAIDKYILGDFIAFATSVEFALTKVAGFVIISIEFYSIDESIRQFNNGKGLGFYFKRAIGLVKSVKKDVNDIQGQDGGNEPS